MDKTPTGSLGRRARPCDGRSQADVRRSRLDPGRHLAYRSVRYDRRGGRNHARSGLLDSSLQTLAGIPEGVGIHDLNTKRRAQSDIGGRPLGCHRSARAINVDGGHGVGQVLETVRIAVDHATGIQAEGHGEHRDWTSDEAGLHKLILTRQVLPHGSQSGLNQRVNPFIMTEAGVLPVVRSIAVLREAVSVWRRQGLSVGFVPTMGALHAGHLALVQEAGQRADRVVASIFVNPTQFAAHEDLGTYPRQEARDVELLSGAGCDLLFAPAVEEMYPAGATTTINVGGPAEGLEGAFRPQMFGGVALVVTKLLNQVQADVAVFGEKDWQQLMVVRRLVRDLDIPTEIVGSPTLRDDHGLALSSRNAYLDEAEIAVARRLNAVLAEAAGQATARRPLAAVERDANAALLKAGFERIDYVAIRRTDDLGAFRSGVVDAPARILAAAWLGRTRLIDNMAVVAPA